jgi:phosphoglycolate phosphatase-like HAD superfamily hydrolase
VPTTTATRLTSALGIDPYPGTLNLIVEADEDVKAWEALRSSPGFPIPPPAGFCAGRCYAVRVNRLRRGFGGQDDLLPAGVVVPDVPAYPVWQVEIIAAVPLRETLSITDGDLVTVEPSKPCAARAVIFDVDATLVDSLTAYRIVAERAAAPFGVVITDAIVREALNTTRHFWDIALHTLRARGVKLGIMSASRRGSVDPLRQHGLLDLFDAIVTGEDVGQRKPDPEGLLMCAAGLDVPPGDAAYVGDTPLDIRAARAAGMFSIGVLSGAGDSAILSAAGADRLIPSVARLSDSFSIVI